MTGLCLAANDPVICRDISGNSHNSSPILAYRQLTIDHWRGRIKKSLVKLNLYLNSFAMELDTSEFLSDFSNYYSVFVGGEEDGTWGSVPVTGEQQQIEYFDCYDNADLILPNNSNGDSCLDIITIHSLGEPTENCSETVITTTNQVDYYPENTDQISIPMTISEMTGTALDLDYISETCPFDWDLNLENLLTTKTDLPDLTPLCNDICNEYVEESSEILSSHHLPNISEVTTSDDVSEMKFQCPYEKCRKMYQKAAHLRSHVRRHLGDKPYICNWQNCKWRFNRSDELARHKRSHSGLKPYHCDYCPKKFSRSDHLAKHRKVHERKFASGKAKGVWRVLPKAKPGRKPKALKQLEEQKMNYSL